MDESKLYGVSVRGWLAVILIVTVCVMSIIKVDVKEPLYSLVLMAAGFYLGSKSLNQNKNANPPVAP